VSHSFAHTPHTYWRSLLGIVYTPTEVVDYLLHSADYVLRQHFGKGLTDAGVHVLDPFTGTGTFITRLLQSGLIRKEDATRKFESELHANEMVLLAYYIAAVNVEVVYQEAFGGEYRPFTGIVWTDTFQMTENEQALDTDDGAQLKILELNGSVNSERAIRQMREPIRVIVGNPPYSAGQESADDNNQNLKYPGLDARIALSYAALSTAKLKRGLYDSYIRAIRWSSDRIGSNGVIALVTNASFIDSNVTDGVRAALTDEFSSIWVLNARGNARTAGEQRQKEKGNLFGAGSRSPIALTLLVKDPAHEGSCDLYYHDIGDYLDRKEKLAIIRDVVSAENVTWQRITPNAQHDWINQRDPAFEEFLPMGDRLGESVPVFEVFSSGVKTNRDAWVYNFSSDTVRANILSTIESYNYHLALSSRDGHLDVIRDPNKIKWDRTLENCLRRSKLIRFDELDVRVSSYRPYVKEYLYFSRCLNNEVYKNPQFFPLTSTENRVIEASGMGVNKPFSVLMMDCIPDVQMMPNGQAFPLYWYEDVNKSNGSLSRQPALLPQSGWDVSGYVRHDGINSSILKQYQKIYDDPSITKEDIFYYVYGVLHSPEYRERFGDDLKKMLPRIPFTEDFWAFSSGGRELGEIHVGYESVQPWPVTETRTKMPFSADGQGLDDRTVYRVEKMKWGGNARNPDKSVIIYNSHFTLSDIPQDAYDYIVNGKSAIEWIIERYAVTQDKDSRIVNDPNEWSDDPRYIIDLVKRIVRVSMETNRIVASLPTLNERDVEIKPGVMSVQ
jgi:predicted helicase